MPLQVLAEPIVKQEKKKILFLSDAQTSPSGVGSQAFMLIEGLIKTGKYTFRCLGGAIQHPDYNTIFMNPDFIIKPVDGFGTKEQIRILLATEKPDVIFIFTDPRQFMWLWEMEDEIHSMCPIAYWHVWDNDPYPAYNKVWYDSTDLINCLSYKTYEMLKPHFPEKVNYIPHSFPKTVFFPGNDDELKKARELAFKEKKDWFIALWVNRNAHRKMPAEVLEAWKLFLENLEKEKGHRNALLVMHTDPTDQEGPPLHVLADYFGIRNNIHFSTQHVPFSTMNVMHNIVDCTLSISFNEGFGLGTLSSLQVGKPIIALKTGGMTRQVIDHRDGTELGVALEPITRKLAGSQMVPYIYQDYTDKEHVAKALMKVCNFTPEEKQKLKEKAIDYVNYEFSYENMITEWDRTLSKLIEDWHENIHRRWELIPLADPNLFQKQQNKETKVVNKETIPSIQNSLKKVNPDLLRKFLVAKNNKE